MPVRFFWQPDPGEEKPPPPTGFYRDGFCDQCGERADYGDHGACERRREFEPPRYCADCARRMVVQVTPAGWTAVCRKHGERTGH